VSHARAGWNGNLLKMDRRLSLQGSRYSDNVRFPMLALCFFSKFLYRHVKLRRSRKKAPPKAEAEGEGKAEAKAEAKGQKKAEGKPEKKGKPDAKGDKGE